MFDDRKSSCKDASQAQGLFLQGRQRGQCGASMIEILLVVFVLLITASVASPMLMGAIYNIRLRGAANDLSSLMQQARIQAARKNTTYDVLYTTIGGTAQSAYVDLNPPNGSYVAADPVVEFSGTVVPASGAPTGSGSQPPAYVLSGDTSSGSVYTNSTTLAFSSRGLPCAYDVTTTPPTCATPATNYFVYYLTDTRMGASGWAVVVVTKSGRTKVVMWDGSTWH